MRAILKLKSNEVWIPHRDDFLEITDQISRALGDVNPNLARRFVFDWTGYTGFLDSDLADLNVADFNLVTDAMEQIIDNEVKSLETSPEPSIGRVVYVHRLVELKALMRADLRSTDAQAQHVYGLRISNGRTWEAKGWVYDFVIECLAIRLAKQSGRVVIDALLNLRTNKTSTSAHHQSIDFEQGEVRATLMAIHESYLTHH